MNAILPERLSNAPFDAPAPAATTHRSGAQVLVQTLLDLGVDTIFGYPGGAVLPLYDALHDEPALRHVLVRHEQAAVHAAQGYARSTGRVGVVLVTSGPGIANTTSGLLDALSDSIPVLCISGRVATHGIGTAAFQECDALGISRPVTKWNAQVRESRDVERLLRKAWAVASGRRPGPVLLDVPKDAQLAPAPGAQGLASIASRAPDVDQATSDRATARGRANHRQRSATGVLRRRGSHQRRSAGLRGLWGDRADGWGALHPDIDVGQHQMWAAQHLRFEVPRRWLTSGGAGTMGCGLPAAIGAQIAHPRSLVVCVSGDASVLTNTQELSTAVQHRTPGKLVLCNNGRMGMVRQWQELVYGDRCSHSWAEALPDFVMLAQAFGWSGASITRRTGRRIGRMPRQRWTLLPGRAGGRRGELLSDDPCRLRSR